MRIAYIAPYQGPSLVQTRPSLHNLSLGARMKVELIAELLRMHSHEVEILSQGPIDKFQLKFYPSFCETQRFHPDIPVYYSSALPVKFMTGRWESFSTRRLLRTRHETAPFNLVIVYNMKSAQIACARYARRHLNLPVILEYEDDSFMDIREEAKTGLLSRHHRNRCLRLLENVSGCLAGSPYLLSQVQRDVPKLLFAGVVGEAILKAGTQANDSRKDWVVFSGTHSRPQGLEQLISAWGAARLPGWELHIAGEGEVTTTLHKLAEGNPNIVFHGVLNREENALLLTKSKIAIVPYEVSQTQGFSFKTIECLGAGLHVITTPLRALEGLEPEMKVGITYITDNRPDTIAAALKRVIENREYERHAKETATERYGPAAAARSLGLFLKQVMAFRTEQSDYQSVLSSHARSVPIGRRSVER